MKIGAFLVILFYFIYLFIYLFFFNNAEYQNSPATLVWLLNTQQSQSTKAPQINEIEMH